MTRLLSVMLEGNPNPLDEAEELRAVFVRELYLVERVLSQDRRQRGRKVYAPPDTTSGARSDG